MREKGRREVREHLIVSLQKEKATIIADKDDQLKAKDKLILARYQRRIKALSHSSRGVAHCKPTWRQC